MFFGRSSTEGANNNEKSDSYMQGRASNASNNSGYDEYREKAEQIA